MAEEKKINDLLNKEVDRRSFVVGGLATAVVGAVAGGTILANSKEVYAATETWDGEADVVVLGFGAAGGAAACSAVDAGLSVLVLESTAVPGGTTRTAGGTAWIPNNYVMKEQSIPDSEEDARKYLTKGNGGQVDAEIVEAFIKVGPEMIDFLHNKVGINYASGLPDYHPEWPGGKRKGRAINPTYGTKTSGEALMAGLYDYAVAKGVRFAFNCHANGLIQDADDKVIGIEAVQNGQKKRIKAKNGVVLATGGFDWDKDLRANYQRGPQVASICLPPMDGSGLRMAQGVGAELRNMNESFGLIAYLEDGWEAEVAAYRENIKDYKKSTWKKIVADWFLWRGKPGAIIVNKAGKRFCNEASDYDTVSYAFNERETFGGCEWRNVPAYTIMDAEAFKKYNLGLYTPGEVRPFVKSAATLDELAKIMGIDAAGLIETVEVYNSYAKDKKDPFFHRGESYFDRAVSGDAALAAKDPEDPACTLRPLGAGPYYAAQVMPISTGTCGGPRVNGKAQVLHVTGNIIKGLYAAGNAAGVGGPGMTYPGPGGTIGPALVFGYIAGKTLAKG